MSRKDTKGLIKSIKEKFSRKTKDKIWREERQPLHECNDEIEASDLDHAKLNQTKCFGNEKVSGRTYGDQPKTSARHKSNIYIGESTTRNEHSERIRDNVTPEFDDDSEHHERVNTLISNYDIITSEDESGYRTLQRDDIVEENDDDTYIHPLEFSRSGKYVAYANYYTL